MNTPSELGNIILALIAATPPTIAIMVTAVTLTRGQRDMHLQMNSRLDQLVQAQMVGARAAGVEQERREQRERAAAAISDVQNVQVVNQPDHPVPNKPIE